MKRLNAAGVIVLVLLNVLALLALAQVEWNDLTFGTYGLTWGAEGVVHDVDPNGPAAKAGIVAGNRVAWTAVTPEDRLSFLFPNAGDTVTVTLEGTPPRTVRLTAAAEHERGILRSLHLIVHPLLVFFALCLATAVLLLRPGRATWTFYAFVWLSTILAFQDYFYVKGSVAIQLAVQTLYDLSFAAALLTLAIFATRVINPDRRLQRRWEALLVALAIVDFAIWNYFMIGYTLALPTWPFGVAVAGQLADIALAAAVLYLLSTIVGRAREEMRVRARWIVAGLGLQPIVVILNSLQNLVQELVFHWTGALLYTPLFKVLEPWAAFIGAVAVSYAFVNERIIDIGFAIGRATGYAITSALLVLFMAISEWAVGELFADSHLAAYATLAAALLGAFSFSAIHHRIDAILDWLFFRREFLAERRLKRDARALAFVTSERSVIEMILDEPLEALELSSAALFKLDEDRNVYACAAMRAWPQDAMITISTDDPLVAQLRSEREPLALHEVGWSHEGMPVGAQAPVLAVPALARSDLYAFALYGARRDGAVLNSDERALLGSLVSSAAATFDHLDAQRAREEIQDLRRRLSELTGTA
ncbi:MAG TPA: hypothetical protein VGG89_14315 [Candidatus Baltobacteraceae bacterium]|jgi:hypothetical protein